MSSMRSQLQRTAVALLGLVVAGAALVSGAVVAHGATVRGGEYYEVGAGTELDGDLYFAGKSLTLSGTTTGDVLAVGSQLTATGTVVGDTLLVGGRVEQRGIVKGDARLVGGQVTVEGTVDEDLVIVGASVYIAKSAVVHGDLLVYGDELTVDGTVDGAAEVRVRTATLDGRFGRNVNVRTGQSLVVGNNAIFAGDLSYSAPREVHLPEAKGSLGGAVHYAPLTGAAASGPLGTSFLLLLLLSIVAAGSVLLVFPAFTRRVIDHSLSNTGIGIAKGFILLFALPGGAVLLSATILGIIPGLVLLFMFFVLMLVSFAVTPVLVGSVLARWLKKTDGFELSWAAFGAIVLAALALVPLIGFLVGAAFFLIVFATVCGLTYEVFWVSRKVVSDSKGTKKHDANKKDKNDGKAA